MRVIADQFLVNAVVLQQFLGLPRVFAGDQVGFLQNADRAQRNVFQVSDRRGHQVQATASRSFCRPSVIMRLSVSLACTRVESIMQSSHAATTGLRCNVEHKALVIVDSACACRESPPW